MHLLNTLPQRLDPGATPTFTGLLTGDGTAAAPSISFSSDQDTGFYRNASGQMGFSANGALSLWFATGGRLYGASVEGYTEMPSGGGVNLVAAGSNKNITLTPSGTGYVDITGSRYLLISTSQGKLGTADSIFTSGSATNTALSAFSSGNLCLGTGVTESARLQSNGRFLLGTTTDSANGILQLAAHTTSAGGIGFGTDFAFYRQSATQITIGNAGQEIVSFYKVGAGMKLEVNGGTVASPQITANGDSDTGIYWALGNDLRLVTGGIAALTLDSSQNATFAGHVATAAAASFGWIGRGGIYAPADGVFRLANNSGTDFNRLQFGGTTNSFPALKRNGTALEVRLADDSSHAAMFVSTVGFGAMGTFTGAGDGVFLMRDNAATSFGRLQFGGTTSSFPSLKRDGTAITVKLADDSAYASFAANSLAADDGITAPGGSVGFARIYVDSADGDLKVVFGDGVVKTLATDT